MKSSIFNFHFFSDKKAFTLVEVLIGTFLISVIFLGIFGAYQLGLKVVSQSKNRVIATAIAVGEIEKIRNLPYESVGIVGEDLPHAEGILESTATTVNNGTQYQIGRRVEYIFDAADGMESPEDFCYLDYKRAEIKVSWSGRFTGEVLFMTDIAPKNKVQEAWACQSQPGGILSVSVFDAYGIMVQNPSIEVFDLNSGERIAWKQPFSGKSDIPLSTSTYKVVISKDGYNAERTYGTNEVDTPDKPHPLIIEGKLTPISFSIDKVSSFLVDTFSAWGSSDFSDPFLDETKISEKYNLLVDGGKADLATSEAGYFSDGYLFSTEVFPTNSIRWDRFSFSNSEPIGTNIKYQIYYASGTEWYLVPDEDLVGNSVGFDISPVNLSGLSLITYEKLKIKGGFSSIVATATPSLYDWQISWITSEAVHIPNVSFELRGAKTIGKDSEEKPVYKYSTTTSSDSGGHKDIQNLEWDLYTFSAATGLDLVDIQPSPQPVNLSPDSSLPVKIYLDAQNSLLLSVEDSVNLEPIFSAVVRMYKSDLTYDKTQYTDGNGQTYFIPLDSGAYNLEISGPEYFSTSTSVSISGDETKTIKLDQAE